MVCSSAVTNACSLSLSSRLMRLAESLVGLVGRYYKLLLLFVSDGGLFATCILYGELSDYNEDVCLFYCSITLDITWLRAWGYRAVVPLTLLLLLFLLFSLKNRALFKTPLSMLLLALMSLEFKVFCLTVVVVVVLLLALLLLPNPILVTFGVYIYVIYC